MYALHWPSNITQCTCGWYGVVSFRLIPRSAARESSSRLLNSLPWSEMIAWGRPIRMNIYSQRRKCYWLNLVVHHSSKGKLNGNRNRQPTFILIIYLEKNSGYRTGWLISSRHCLHPFSEIITRGENVATPIVSFWRERPNEVDSNLMPWTFHRNRV